MAEECILLVEGEDDEHVVRQLCRACNVGLNFSIERKSYIDGIPEENRRFKRGKISKANLYAWLASLEQPQRMGAAIGAGDLDAEAPLGQRFAKWLSKLFDE